tara:strand:+ start:81 stop:593 length:513 start_codon:yes stop_codon:yes gene_type:complete
MKGERILYVILILVALVSGVYGYVSGLFTPHHYYEVDESLSGSCTPTDKIYINKREKYLIWQTSPLESDDTYTMRYDQILEDRSLDGSLVTYGFETSISIWSVHHSISDNKFYHEVIRKNKDEEFYDIVPLQKHQDWEFDIIEPTQKNQDEEYNSSTVYRTCNVTKQFLQ